MPGEKLRYPGRNYLFAPGPTHIPVVVQNAMNTPMEDHRAPDFPSLVKPILRDLKKVFLTKTGTNIQLSMLTKHHIWVTYNYKRQAWQKKLS